MIVHVSIHMPKPGVEAMRASVASDPFDGWEAAEAERLLLKEV
jgi:hypothetical protein